MEEKIFTRDEAADFLRVSEGTVAEWIKSGRLAASQKPREKEKPISHLQDRLHCSPEEPDPQSAGECG
jgi:hypothetical protein